MVSTAVPILKKDVVNKKGDFIACVNDVISEFASVHPTVTCKLLSTVLHFMDHVCGICMELLLNPYLLHGI